jgi:hypothetical protein
MTAIEPEQPTSAQQRTLDDLQIGLPVQIDKGGKLRHEPPAMNRWGLEVVDKRVLDALVEEAKERERQFPMQDGPSIPWSLAERIYFVYTVLYGEGQGMETLAKRRGFSWAEIPAFREAYRRRTGAYPAWQSTTKEGEI